MRVSLGTITLAEGHGNHWVFVAKVVASAQPVGVQSLYLDYVKERPVFWRHHLVPRYTTGPTTMSLGVIPEASGVITPETAVQWAFDVSDLSPGVVLQAVLVSTTPRTFRRRRFREYKSNTLTIPSNEEFWSDYDREMLDEDHPFFRRPSE